MRGIAKILFGLGLLTGMISGCADSPPPVERVPVAAPDGDVRRGYDRVKPLPEQSRLYDRDIPPEPPFDDPPLVNQKTPEQGRFETAYRGVGRPRIAVFVNRTLEGAILPANKETAAGARAEEMRRPDRYGEPRNDRPYLKHGEYDEAGARSLDYEAVENILTDFLACQGTIEIMSPTMARQRLSDEQVKDLQSGRPQAMREIAQQLDTDVLIQVTAHPTRQTQYGLEFRLVGEALNIKGGQQVGRAVVDIPPPLEKTTLNRYTRFMARKLMMDMTQSWSSTEPAPRNAPPAAPEPEKK